MIYRAEVAEYLRDCELSILQFKHSQKSLVAPMFSDTRHHQVTYIQFK